MKYLMVATVAEWATTEKVKEGLAVIAGWAPQQIKEVHQLERGKKALEYARVSVQVGAQDVSFLSDDYYMTFIDEVDECDLERTVVVYEIEWEPLSTNYEIMVGLNDKDTHQQEITDEVALDRIGTILQECTIQECHGFYHGEHEKSFRVTVYGVELPKVLHKASKIRRSLNQECVIVTDIKEQKSTFIYH